jgi:hypothetical protein
MGQRAVVLALQRALGDALEYGPESFGKLYGAWSGWRLHRAGTVE